nr:MAG TPA: hypothetical protein [Caudoviricetes sp.]
MEGLCYVSIRHSAVIGGAVILPWRLAVAEVFILHYFKKSYKSVGEVHPNRYSVYYTV